MIEKNEGLNVKKDISIHVTVDGCQHRTRSEHGGLMPGDSKPLPSLHPFDTLALCYPLELRCHPWEKGHIPEVSEINI